MTATQNTGMAPREDAAFTFTANGKRFYPQSGARLSYASRTAATLFLPGMPSGLIASGDTVTVKYNGSTVFAGTLKKYTERTTRGLTVLDMKFADRWDILERRVFRQEWKVAGEGGASVSTRSARLVLNVDELGLPVMLPGQIGEICSYGGIMNSDGGIPNIALPADVTENLTCADAIRRLLRLFPQVVAYYNAERNVVQFSVPDTSKSPGWLSEGRILSSAKQYTAHPVVGVDIATESVDKVVVDADGATVDMRAYTHQTAGNVNSDDCLHVFMPLAGGSASSSWESLEVTTEEMPLLSTPSFWRDKHPRLANVPLSAISISEAGRSSTTYDRITSNDIGALRAFGLNAEVVHCHCKATVTTEDDVEEELYLTMDFTMTDASPGRHTRQIGSSSMAGETLPEGLAGAILAQRSEDLEEEDVEIALGEAFPTVGETLDGLVCQTVEVDCDSRVARLHFGHPDYLSAEDMRSLLNGFRGRAYASNIPQRGNTDPGAGEAVDVAGGIQPLTTTEFAPGTKAKTTVKSSSGGGSIVLDSTKVGSGKKVDVHNLKFTPSGASGPTTVKVLADQDIEIPPKDEGDGWKDHESETDSNVTFAERNDKLYVGVYYT